MRGSRGGAATLQFIAADVEAYRVKEETILCRALRQREQGEIMTGGAFEAFSDNSVDPRVRGFLHRATGSAKSGLVFTHGAGGNAKAGLPLAIAEAFTEAGFVVLRCDLP